MKDIVIIGGGPGGYVAAIRASQLGANVLLVEENTLGGTCLNEGCIPTKTLYRSAEILKSIRECKNFGIEVDNIKLNLNTINSRKDEVVNTLVSGVKTLLKENKVEVIYGKASIIDKNTVRIIKPSDESEDVKCKNIIIATGSESSVPPIKGYDSKGVITSREALNLKEIPKTLAIVGGGVIGMEFANIFNVLGAKVIVIEALDSILYNVDRDITKRFSASCKRKGIDIFTSTFVKEISNLNDKIVVKVEGKKETKEIFCDKVLVATGRTPRIQGLNLNGVNVLYDKKGIKVDENYKTNIENIYAIGDVNGLSMLAHAASHEGVQVVENMILGKKCENFNVPSSIFVFPEISSVGITEEEAKFKNISYKKSKFMFGANGKALALGEGEGFVKIIASQDETILGVHIMGPHASDLIGEASIVVYEGLKAKEIKKVVHSHPTLGEAFYEAVLSISKEGIHSVN